MPTTLQNCPHFWRDRHKFWRTERDPATGQFRAVGTPALHCEECCDEEIEADGKEAVRKYRGRAS